METDNFIEVRNLCAKFGSNTVLDGVNLTVKRGEVLVILGGSGSGKSTLLRNMVGLMKPHSGQILYDGQDYTGMTQEEQTQVRKRFGMCFQGSALFNSMTIADNVALPLREHTQLEESTIEIMTKIKLELVGLGGHEDLLPSQLSGGMKKRAGLARAMAMDPEIIYYDEPSAGLDPIVAAGIDMLIRKMQQTFNLTSVVVTHEMESVKLIADRVCMLHKGKVICIDTLDKLKENPHPFVQQFFERKQDEENRDSAEYYKSLTS